MRARRHAVTVLLLGFTAVCVYNVAADNAEVVALAETQACGKPHCAVQKTRESRNPFGQSFQFQTVLKNRNQPAERDGGLVDVDCHRAAYLVGPYACARDEH
jgi:hypothetical protein